MTAKLRQLFRLQPGEVRPLVLLALLGALLQGGLAIGISTADSLFLTRIGVSRLPVIFLLTPVMMLAYTPLYSFLLTRLGIARIFQGTLLILVAGGVLFAGAFMLPGAVGAPAWLYYAAKLYAVLWWIALYTLYWNFVDNYFNILEAKRLYALLSGACAAGAGLGGLLVAGLSRHLAVDRLFLAWSAVALATLPLLLRILRRCRAIEDDDTGEERGRAGLWSETGDTFRLLVRSRYVGLLAAAAFVVLLAAAVCEFQYLAVFSAKRTEQELAGLFGRLYAGVNVFNVAFNVFLFNRLVARLGVRNTVLIQPVAFAVVFLAFLVDEGDAAALLGFLACQGLLVSIEYNNFNFLINALPAGSKPQLRALIEGLGEPLAMALAGLFLLSLSRALGPANLALAGLGLAAGALGIALALRPAYGRAMVANLKRGWLDFSRPLAELMGSRPAAELAWLADTARHGRPAEALRAIRLLWLGDKHLAAACLLEFIAAAGEDGCAAAQPLIAQMLAEDDHEIVRGLLDWLNRGDTPLCATMLEELGQRGLIPSPELKANLPEARPATLRAASAAALLQSWKVEDSLGGLQTLKRLLEGSPRERRAAVRALGRFGQSRYAHFLVPLLQSPEPEDRRESLEAITRLAGRESARLLPALLRAVQEGAAGERSLALRAVRQIGDPDCVAPLLDAAPAFSPRELREAEEVLLAIERRGVPAVVSYLLDSGHPYAGRDLAARALTRISFAQYEAVAPGLIDAEISRAHAFLGRHARLRASAGPAAPGRAVLCRYYGDQPDAVIDFVLELLGLGGRLADFESVTASLRSPHPKERADAIETVEQSCRQAVFVRLLPLLDGQARAAARPGPEPDDALIREACRARWGIEAAAGLRALWETDPEAMRGLLAERLRTADVPPGFRPFVLTLLERFRARPGPPEPDLVEIVDALAAAPFFDGLRVEDLVPVAALASYVRAEAGPLPAEAGRGAQFGLVLAGAAEIGGRTIPPGGTFGESALWAAPAAGAVTGRGLQALRFDPAAVLALARRSPRLALALLRQKLEATHAA